MLPELQYREYLSHHHGLLGSCCLRWHMLCVDGKMTWNLHILMKNIMAIIKHHYDFIIIMKCLTNLSKTAKSVFKKPVVFCWTCSSSPGHCSDVMIKFHWPQPLCSFPMCRSQIIKGVEVSSATLRSNSQTWTQSVLLSKTKRHCCI